jgi:type III secretion protein T
MTENELIAIFRHMLLVMTLLLPRMLVIFAIIPFFSTLLHGHIRNSLVFSLVLILYPMVAPTITIDPGFSLDLLIIISKELFIGLLLGFLLSIVFWAVESAGAIIDQQRGAGMAAVFNPLSGHQDSPYSLLLLQTMVVVFFTSGGFLLMLQALFESYRLWPINNLLPEISGQFPTYFLSCMDALLEFSVLYAAPIVITLLLVDFMLGLINRFTPQLNSFFLAMPIKSGLTVTILMIYIFTLKEVFNRDLLDFYQTILFLNNIIHYP